MKFSFILLLLIAFSAIAKEEKSTVDLLREHFPGAIKSKSENEIWFERVGITDIFISNEGGSDLANYIYIQLYQMKSATLLEHLGREPKFRDRAKEYPRIFKSMTKYCSEELVTPVCVLEGMELKLGINECGGRSDEGYFCTDCSGKTECEKDHDVIIIPLF